MSLNEITPITSSQCISCKWFMGDTGDDLVCFAFPEGIPDEILTGQWDHRIPYEGDNDKQWELNPEYNALEEEATL